MSRTKGHFFGPVVLFMCVGLVASVMALVMAYLLIRPAAAEPTAPKPVYAVKGLGTLLGEDKPLGEGTSIARDINDDGQVVGQSQNASGQNRAFLWEESQGMKDLGTLPEGTFSFARGINDSRQVVGFSRTSSTPNPVHGFLWESDSMTDLGTLPIDNTLTKYTSSEAWHINDSGVAVGRSFNSGSQGRAVLWENGQIKPLGASLDTPYSEAWGINDLGQVVGEAGVADQQAKAYLYDNNTDGVTNLDPLIDRSRFFSDPLDLPDSYTFSEAMGINDRGQVVGWVYRTTTNKPPSTPPGPEGKAFLYEKGSDGTATVVPLEPVAGKRYSRARDIDESGRAVVGWSRGTDGNDAAQFSATLWKDGKATDLNDLIPADSRGNPTNPGWKLTDAYAINEFGQIVGAGYYYHKQADGTVIQGQLQAFLLTPDIWVSHKADGSNGWNKTSPVTLRVSASDTGNGLEGDPICTDFTNNSNNLLTLAAGSAAGTWTANVSGQGVHSITCTVSDEVGNTASASDTVKIDTLAPSVSCSVTPSKLSTSANNHKLVSITANVKVTDSGSGDGGFKLVSVISNQADSGLGPGDVPNDIQGWTTGGADLSGQLRAERYGGARVYTLTYQGNDVAGNTSSNCLATVTVPKGG